MTYEAPLSAIADPTRRAILDALREGPRPVGEIADPLPVSRPAVSQHLKTMLEAGLLTMRKDGTRNLYAMTPAGLDALRAWIEALYEAASVSEARAAEASAQAQTSDDGALPPVVKTLHVRLTPAEAFHLFTEDIALWWPVASHSVSAADGGMPMAVVFQGGKGGAITETLLSGQQSVWADITDWAAPHRLAMDWHPGQDRDNSTQVRLQFEAAGQGCRIILTHDGWGHVGGTALRAEYDSGWAHVFQDRFGAAAAASLSNF